MGGIPITRGQFLLPFVNIHDEIGASTTSLLARLRLPTSLEEKANHYVPLAAALRFAEAAQRSQGIVDIGFRASQRLQFCHLSEKIRAVIGYSPTLFSALQQICKWAALEDSTLSMWLENCGDYIRICSKKFTGSAEIPHLEHAQWLQNILVIHIVRQFAGPAWDPATIAFEARYTPGLETRSFWPNTRFLAGQKASWIDVPVSALSLANPASKPSSAPLDERAEPSGNDIIGTLKLMLPTYLEEGALTVAEIADMAGLSVRSLQRTLMAAGLSYSGLIEAARFENASKLLGETDAKIIEVAFLSGYSDPAHFTRAFRRISGVTPRQFRGQRRER